MQVGHYLPPASCLLLSPARSRPEVSPVTDSGTFLDYSLARAACFGQLHPVFHPSSFGRKDSYERDSYVGGGGPTSG